ncbi:hypothetical protein SKAU_G00289940 [Synaphobranchus kaupii]|uniref:LRAT domain-containing protein n=1 Tax=Synaphobranchus kaupii TaxID=118154 RepID=A0A9Q1IM98_SYNKA|nr:hypothetical protein SKAU_G00289940 [Synaphobranchus kaupii]
MAATVSNKEPKPGDLIEIVRTAYEHWAVYVGDGLVIHLSAPNETAHSSANSKSVLSSKVTVKMEKLEKVVGRHTYRINNLLDNKYESKSPDAIVKEAKSLLGQEQQYRIFASNCEHFVTELRYGKAESRQVRIAAEVAAEEGRSKKKSDKQ